MRRGSMDTQQDVQHPKEQPVVYICGECDTDNEIKSRDPVSCSVWAPNNVQEQDKKVGGFECSMKCAT